MTYYISVGTFVLYGVEYEILFDTKSKKFVCIKEDHKICADSYYELIGMIQNYHTMAYEGERIEALRVPSLSLLDYVSKETLYKVNNAIRHANGNQVSPTLSIVRVEAKPAIDSLWNRWQTYCDNHTHREQMFMKELRDIIEEYKIV